MEPIIQLKNVSKSFKSKDNQVDALKNINLSIYPGDIYGIIGMSGAGKSTLIRTMNLLTKPDQGEVIVNQQQLSTLSERDLYKVRQKIGMIFQHFNLLSQKSVLENVCLPLKVAHQYSPSDQEKAKKLLAIVGLEDKINAYPKELSGGQKQRIAIARALINDPEILLCDEATSALDPSSTQSILNLLKELHQKLKITIVLITHEMSVIERICHKVAILDEGTVVEEGRVVDIFVNPQSKTAKNLLFLQDSSYKLKQDRYQLRITFEGTASDQPILSQIILKTKQELNILWANTKEIEGKTYGQMMIEVSSTPTLLTEIMNELKFRGVSINVEGGHQHESIA